MKTSSHPWIHATTRIAVIALLGAAGGAVAGDREDDRRIEARLRSYQEVPAVSSPATGRFKAKVDEHNLSLSYELSYADLAGEVTQAHIHIGQRGVNGGIMVWLCGTTAIPGPAGTPVCPAPSGTVNGIIQGANVAPNAGAIAQGIAAGEFAEVLAAIRAGVAYANVHSTLFPGGELRGQLRHDD